MFNDVCTVYNKYIDPVTRAERWQRTVLTGIFWDSSKGATLRKTGSAAADGLRLIIPFAAQSNAERTYLKPHQFASAEDKFKHWTLGSKDTVVLGEIKYEVVKSASELERMYDDVLLINNVDTRGFGGNMAHWEVSGK